MNKQQAYRILTNPNTVIIDYTNNSVNKIWKEAYDIAVDNLQQSKKIVQTIKTYKGMLQKQNKIIDAMAKTIIEDSHKLGTYWCNGCQKVGKCPYKEHKDCVREHFEKSEVI